MCSGWPGGRLEFGIGGIAGNLDELVVEPIRKLAGRTRNYELGDPFPFPRERIERAQGAPTRFAVLDAATQDDLIDWRYVIADTSLRWWFYPLVPRPLRLPAT